MSEEFFYKEIGEEEVPCHVRAVAEKVLDYCKAALELRDDVKIQWIREADQASAELDESFVKLEQALKAALGDRSEVRVLYRRDDTPFYGQMGEKHWLRGKILIRADVPMREIALTICHELKHFSDFGINSGKFRPPYLEEEKKIAERRAEDFARTIIEKMEHMGLLKTF
jgi:hypothetical protein